MTGFIEMIGRLAENEMFGGMLAVGIVGGILFQLRAMPQRLWMAFRSQFVVELTVFDSDDVYPLLSYWLGTHASGRKARRLRVATRYNAESNCSETGVSPGEGMLLLREAGRTYLFQRLIEQPQQGQYRRTETIRISTFGRSSACLANLLVRVRESLRETDTVPVKMWSRGGYSLAGRRLRRGLETVYLEPGLKDDIRADIERFRAAKDWYAARGVPWRRGYLFAGDPGTGKSSLIFALACHFRASVHVINLSTVKDDNELHEAFHYAGAEFIALEDIDAARVMVGRTEDGEKSGITLSGLLNVIDGIASHEGRVVFMTSNHPETLDPALVRAGRIDRTFTLEAAGPEVAAQMVAGFLPDADERQRAAFVDELDLPVSQAKLQNLLLERSAA